MTCALVETDRTSLGRVGSYGAYLSMWGMSGATIGKDFTAGARYDTERVNENVAFGWQLPSNWNGGARGFPHIFHANYDDSGPSVQQTSRKVSQISRLFATLRFQTVGDPFSLLNEFYLTSTAHQTGSLADKTLEVGSFPHVSQNTIDFMESVTKVGSYTDAASRPWKVSVNEDVVPFVMFRPSDGSDAQGQADWKDRLLWLVAQGLAKASDYYNGIAFGPEPRLGKGAAMVSMMVDYA